MKEADEFTKEQGMELTKILLKATKDYCEANNINEPRMKYFMKLLLWDINFNTDDE